METCALKVTSAFLCGLTVPSITPAARPVKGCLSPGSVLYCPGTKQKGVYRHVPALSHRGKCQAGVKPLCHPIPRCFPAAISVRRGGPDRGGTVCRPGGHRCRVYRQPGHAGGDQFYYRPLHRRYGAGGAVPGRPAGGGRKPGHRHPVFPLCPHRRGPGGRLRPVHQHHRGADAGARRGGGARPAVPVYLRLRPGVHHRLQYGQRRAPGPGGLQAAHVLRAGGLHHQHRGGSSAGGSVRPGGGGGRPRHCSCPGGEPGPGPGGTPPPGLPL